MADVTALRYETIDEDGNVDERDALVAVEVSDVFTERGIDVHVAPRTPEVYTFSVSPAEAWQLARELGRAASLVEAERG